MLEWCVTNNAYERRLQRLSARHGVDSEKLRRVFCNMMASAWVTLEGYELSLEEIAEIEHGLVDSAIYQCGEIDAKSIDAEKSKLPPPEDVENE